MVRVINTEKKNEMIWKVSVEIQRFIKEYVVLSQYYATFFKSLKRFSNSFQDLRSQSTFKNENFKNKLLLARSVAI